MRGLRSWPLLLLLCLPCLLSACSSSPGIKVHIEYDPDADFSGFQSYSWKPDGQQVLGRSILPKEELQEKLRKLIDSEFAKSGFQVKSTESADFMVGYYVARIGKQTVKSYDDYDILGARWRPIGKRKYHGGSILIDILDPVK